MSLFPAYAEQASKNDDQESPGGKWLENSSFKIDLAPQTEEKIVEIHDSSSSENGNQPKKRKKKEKKTKRKKEKHKKVRIEDEPPKDEHFVVDTKRTKEYLSISTISRPSVPKYHTKFYLNTSKRRRKRKFKRYFKFVHEKNPDKSNSEVETITETSLKSNNKPAKKDENFTGFKQEEELSQRTAYFNKHLAEHPNDVKVWLEYAQFQDMVYQFEKSYRKGSIAKAQRVLAERKLSILDKALSLNANCEDLLRERLKVSVAGFPSDELQTQLRDLVEKDKGNIIYWQGYIEATQCSMSHCNTPAVINLYSKCLATLHQLRRNSVLEKNLLEESILRMLYQCGLFLKQAGLFEQLWTLLRLYLELNLSPNDSSKFNLTSNFKENQLVDLEEVVFGSELPLHELWLRTEKLRESCHWLPANDENCEDPQRMVFAEDVSELIHPITMPENVFKLTSAVFTLLKVPLLPCRHVTMQDLGLDYVPWSLDSIEPVLPVFYPLYGVTLDNNAILSDNRLAVGPQYLKLLPGQEEYLEFVLKIIENCASCLRDEDRTAVTVWWFRFQRLLVILSKSDRFKMADNVKSRLKRNMKNVLKENRRNEAFYLEYALVELESGNFEACFNILNTALDMNENSGILTSNWTNSQATQCLLYRTLVETILLQSGEVSSKKEALKLLCQFVLQRKLDGVGIDDAILTESDAKYKLVALKLLQNNLAKKPTLQHFLPDFLTDFLICHGWFVYLNKGPIECGVYLEKTIESLDEKYEGVLWQKEVVYEFYVAVLFKYSLEQPGIGTFRLLSDILRRAVEKYPNNLFLLSILAKEQSLMKSAGPHWWKVQDLLLRSGRAFPTLFTFLISNQRLLQLQEALTDTVTGEKFGIDSNTKNRMLSLFRKITKSDMCTRRCGLVWRLYLQFVYTYCTSSVCRNVYYSSVEECPWLKALYIDAAIYIPAELAQIQDLIIEKQLRLHVTPEELDVLRS